MTILIYRLRHWLFKHKFKDISVDLMAAYYCDTCYLQKTAMSNWWWYRIAPWLKN